MVCRVSIPARASICLQFTAAFWCIGKSIVVKGEGSGSENVYVASELEGSVELIDGNLTVA